MKTKIAPVVAATFTAFLSGSLVQAAELRVLNWKGYGTDVEWAVADFQAMSGHTVLHDYFNSEQEMLTKLRTNPWCLRCCVDKFSLYRTGTIRRIDFRNRHFGHWQFFGYFT